MLGGRYAPLYYQWYAHVTLNAQILSKELGLSRLSQRSRITLVTRKVVKITYNMRTGNTWLLKEQLLQSNREIHYEIDT